MDPLDDVALLQIAVLQQDLLQRRGGGQEKKEGEDPEDIKPIHGL